MVWSSALGVEVMDWDVGILRCGDVFQVASYIGFFCIRSVQGPADGEQLEKL